MLSLSQKSWKPPAKNIIYTICTKLEGAAKRKCVLFPFARPFKISLSLFLTLSLAPIIQFTKLSS